jgi:protein-tyrosine phosphatase
MSLAIRGILVLCEGNHCRSPIAEALLRAALGERIQVRSAGLRALVDHPAHDEAERLMAEQGLDLTGHRGRQVTAEMALEADLILVMDLAQKEACERLAPSCRGRVYLLGHWLPSGEQQIADPIGGPRQAHAQACEHIRQALQPWLARLGAGPPLHL